MRANKKKQGLVFWVSLLLITALAFGGVPEWPKGADCKSVAFRFGGSNPPSSTIPEQGPPCSGIFFSKTPSVPPVLGYGGTSEHAVVER